MLLLGSLALCLYFTYASLAGNYGLLEKSKLELKEIELVEKYHLLTKKIDAIENKTQRLSNHFLDLELLDQQARLILGYARPDDIIFK